VTAIPDTLLIPRQILFGNPVRAVPEISPDGLKLAYLAPVNDVLNVWVGILGKESFTPVTNDTERGIRNYFWAEDNQHILYLQDKDGNENWRLYATHVVTHETRDLTPFDEVQVQIIFHDKNFPNDILVGLNKDNPQLHDVYHLDLTTGELSLVVSNPGNVIGWIADSQMQVRAALGVRPEDGRDLLVRLDTQSEWSVMTSWNAEDALNTAPVGFTSGDSALYLIDSRGANAGRLVKISLSSGQIEVIAEDPQYDVGEVIIHPDTHEVQAVGFNRDRLVPQCRNKSA
jgi:dipeptidyl aminopeptidase/acylaminoacyl peptidase